MYYFIEHIEPQKQALLINLTLCSGYRFSFFD